MTMNAPRRWIGGIAPLLLLVLIAATLGGCVSFTGPNDLRNQIARTQDVRLKKEEAISVGPLGVLLARVIAGGYIPFDLDGLSSVDYGLYEIKGETSAGSTLLPVADLELPGLERIVRVRDERQETAVMVRERADEKVRELVVVDREANHLQIIRIRGDLEKLVESLSECAGMCGGAGAWMGLGHRGDREVGVEVGVEVDEDVDVDVDVD